MGSPSPSALSQITGVSSSASISTSSSPGSPTGSPSSPSTGTESADVETILGLIKNLSLIDISLLNNLSNNSLLTIRNYSLINNISLHLDIDKPIKRVGDDYLEHRPALQVFFYCLYALIFLIGICGNTLVCYVVFRNKQMHTVTNLFITNLALSDILLCIFSVPITPLYLIFYKEWVFGKALCHLVPYAQGVSVYISAFTLMSIAIDRFFVIIYPFKPRMRINVCLTIITFVWISAALLTLPYGLFVKMVGDERGDHYLCDEFWPVEESRKAFGFSTSVLQFVIPFTIITFCYIRVCGKLRDRARSKPGEKSIKKDEIERERTKRTNRMLIAMVAIFGISWLPLNIHNLVTDFYIPASEWEYFKPFFFLVHAVAMSSTCYNPFLYAWLNENFRKEFKQVLPCYTSSSPPFSFRRATSAGGAGILGEGQGNGNTKNTDGGSGRTGGGGGGNGREKDAGNGSFKLEKTCNGHELIHLTCDSTKSGLKYPSHHGDGCGGGVGVGVGDDDDDGDSDGDNHLHVNDVDDDRPLTMETNLDSKVTQSLIKSTKTLDKIVNTTSTTTTTIKESGICETDFHIQSIELIDRPLTHHQVPITIVKKVIPTNPLTTLSSPPPPATPQTTATTPTTSPTSTAPTSVTYNSDSDIVQMTLGDSIYSSQVV